MKLLIDEKLRNNFFNIKLIVYIFLLWNIFKLFQIEADPIIQLLSALLSIGIYFDIEDKNQNIVTQKLNIKKKINVNLFLSIALFISIIVRSFSLNEISDKFYYFLMPLGILAISVIGKSLNMVLPFRKIIIISFLLPFRRLFFYLLNPLLLFITKYLTWFLLFCLGAEPNLTGRSIFLGGSELIISDGCGGTDNLYFAITTLIIYKMIFSLKRYKSLISIYAVVLLIPIFSNSIRNTLLALIITLNINIRDKMFTFFHDSYGSLIFSLISLLIISYLYFNLLDKELNL